MSLRLRRLKLVAHTKAGPCGVEIDFPDGLVVLRADNTSGKSTCIQAIFYALGLESMLTTRHVVPMPHAMTDYLDTPTGRQSVTDSYVILEVENAVGSRMTVQRWARSENYEPNLVHIWDGPALTNPQSGFRQRDMFVRLPGSAVEGGAGFYPHLEEFIGWHLPRVVRADGRVQKLYMEMVFPLFFVEQKRGWGGIQVQMPPYQGIPEPRRRAIEFTLALDVYERSEQRRETQAELGELGGTWSHLVKGFELSLRGRGAALQGIPDRPSAAWPPEIAPTLAVADGDSWQPLQTAVKQTRQRLADLERREVPKAKAAAAQTEAALRGDEEALRALGAAIGVVAEETQAERQQLGSLHRRLEALQQDLRQNRDALTLRKLGSSLHLQVLVGECPTCHQPVPPSLLDSDDVEGPLSVEENITFIQEQQRAFEAMRGQVSRALEGKEQRLHGMQARMSELRASIRAQRQALVSPDQLPSIAVLEERLRLRDRLDGLQVLAEDLSALLLELEPLAERYRELRAHLAELPEAGLSTADHRKLSELQDRLVAQLHDYGLQSFSPSELEISEVRYTPSREGFDIGFDMSASDGIRTIWAYLLGLLEVARTEDTNHPGLLVFDEPRQQEADPLSLQALVERAATAREAHQQIVFATSEPYESVTTMLSGRTAKVEHFEGKILRPFDPGWEGIAS